LATDNAVGSALPGALAAVLLALAVAFLVLAVFGVVAVAAGLVLEAEAAAGVLVLFPTKLRTPEAIVDVIGLAFIAALAAVLIKFDSVDVLPAVPVVFVAVADFVVTPAAALAVLVVEILLLLVVLEVVVDFVPELEAAAGVLVLFSTKL
jgi:hypothetical protein